MTQTRDLFMRIQADINHRGQPAAVLLGAQVSGLAVARSLGRRGIPIIALDPDPRAIAGASRFVTAMGRIPNPVNDEEGFVGILQALGQHLAQPAVVFPTGDEWASAIAAHAAELGSAFLLPPVTYAAVSRILNKGCLYQEAAGLGIPVPTFVYLKEQSLAVADAFTFPCAVKPAEKRDFVRRYGQAALVVDDAQQVQQMVGRLGHRDIVLQELVPMTDAQLQTVAVYIDRCGQTRGVFVGQRLAVFPAGFGTTCLVQATEDASLVSQAVALLNHFDYRGIAEVEFIWDPRDDTWKLIDINPRCWKWIGLPIFAGIDLPWMAYADAVGCPIERATPTAGVRWASVPDLAALTAQTGTSPLTPSDWSALFQHTARGGIIDATFDPDDVLPFVRALETTAQGTQCACAC